MEIFGNNSSSNILHSKKASSSIMAHSTWHVYGSVFVCLFICFLCQIVIADSDRRPWYEKLPAVSMEYKIQIQAGKEDCFYQYVQPGAHIYLSFQVIHGGDGMAGFVIHFPNGTLARPHEWVASTEYREELSAGGYYGICIDNQLSRFAEKLVNIYMNVIKYEAWEKHNKEIEELHLGLNNFTEVIGILQRNVQDMLFFQSHTRSREARDMALVLDNNSYVQNWSLAQIVVIILTCTFQVYFVRKLFDVKTGYTQTRI